MGNLKLAKVKLNLGAIGCLAAAIWIAADLAISGILAFLGLAPLEALRQWAEVSAPTWVLGLFYGGGYLAILAIWTFIQCIFTITIGVFVVVGLIFYANRRQFRSLVTDGDPLTERLREMGGRGH